MFPEETGCFISATFLSLSPSPSLYSREQGWVINFRRGPMGLYRFESRLLARTAGHLESASYTAYSVLYEEVKTFVTQNYKTLLF